VTEIHVLDDPAAAVAERVAAAAEAGEHIVLTGGSTPAHAYDMAARATPDWSEATVWFGDERCVAPDHPDSNYAMARRALLDRLGAQPQVHRMKGELGPEAGAGDYEALVREHLGAQPRWDLLLLGLGPDGHCASLFPSKPEWHVTNRLVVGVPEAGMEPQVPRISLTLPAIDAARTVLFLITGESKAQAVRRAFGDPPDPDLPAAHVHPSEGELLVFCDPAAAAELER
jgi:6-phosphogluconolactonase